MMLAATAARRIPSSTACRFRVFAASQALMNAAPAPLRSMSSSDDLPYHLVVGMPALSPTMESGTIASWSVEEGDRFIAGDSLAEIETDKATIGFEAQDDGIVAKILAEAGSGEINVGVPIMVTVEEEEDVAAFKDFVPEVTAPASEPESAALPEPETAAPAAEAPAPAPLTPPPASAPEPIVAAVAPAEATPAEVAAIVAPAVPTVGPAWGGLARVASPLAKTLSAEQRAYVEKYGSTGQVPL